MILVDCSLNVVLELNLSYFNAEFITVDDLTLFNIEWKVLRKRQRLLETAKIWAPSTDIMTIWFISRQLPSLQFDEMYPVRTGILWEHDNLN